MKIITFDDVNGMNISPEVCYQWVSEMIEKKKEVLLPPKISLKPMDGVFCNVMPCILNSKCGVKVVTRYPDREPSLDSKILLMDVSNGELLALMDANWITAMRTGAVAAHSILLLAKKDFSTVAMLGLGNTARATLLILAAMCPEKNLTVKLLKYKGQEEIFAERFSSYSNMHFIYVEDNENLVKGSEVVISCVTYFENDICSNEYFEEGVLVVPVHTRGFTNCDLFFDKVFADDYAHVCHFKNFDKFHSFSEISDVVNGVTTGRENDKERILAYNIGISMHDTNFAAHIYQMMIEEKKDMVEIDMHDPTQKFWV